MRESASAGVIWKCWSNISFRLDSAILLSASRRLPLYPKPSELQGRMELLVEAKPGYREWGCWDRGFEAADRGSANTLPSSLSSVRSHSPSYPLLLAFSTIPRSVRSTYAIHESSPPLHDHHSASLVLRHRSFCSYGRFNDMTDCRAKRK